MLVYILTLPYFIATFYLFRRTRSWARACGNAFERRWFSVLLAIIFAFAALSPVIAFFLPHGNARHVMDVLGYFWLGIFMCMGLTVAVADLIRIIVSKAGHRSDNSRLEKRIFVVTGSLILIATVVFCSYGAIHSKHIIVNDMQASVNKELPNGKKKMTVAVVSDIHLGYNTGLKQVKTIVEHINAMNADLVLLPGDTFTNDYDDVRQPEKIIAEFKKIKSRYGVFGCWGNHDVAEPILGGFTFSGKHDMPGRDPRMISFMKKADIEMIEDTSVLVDDSFYIVGRLDADKPATEKVKTLNEVMKDVDTDKLVIMLDHEPRDLVENAAAGIDLDISGHTHNGQFFPMNITQHLTWEHPYGTKEFAKYGESYPDTDEASQTGGVMTSVVTSGAGVYGPNLRVGTDSEVVRLIVKTSK